MPGRAVSATLDLETEVVDLPVATGSGGDLLDSESTSRSPEPDPGDELRTAVSDLVRAEARLILAENVVPLRRSARATVLLMIGAVTLLLALATIGWAVGALLTTWMPAWGAALVVAGVWLLVAAVVFGVLVGRHRGDPVVRLLGPASSQAARDLRDQAVVERERAERRVQDAGLAMAESLAGAAAERGVQAAVAVVGRGAGQVAEEIAELAEDVTDGVEDLLGVGDEDDEDEAESDGSDDGPGRTARVVTAPLRLVIAVLEGGLDRSRRARGED